MGDDDKSDLNEVTLKKETTRGMNYNKKEITLKSKDPIVDLITKAKEVMKDD